MSELHSEVFGNESFLRRPEQVFGFRFRRGGEEDDATDADVDSA